jgi:branched-chain amino acid transport system substrate-binding protein
MGSGLRAALLLACLAAPPAMADILVAFAWDLNGGPVSQAVGLAVEQINASGGLLGQSLKIVTFDDGCQEQQAALIARRIVELHPALVVGHGCSASTILAAPLYQMAGSILITPSSTHPKITDMGLDAVFRMTGRDDRQAQAAVDFIARRWAPSRIAVVDDDSVYARDLTDLVRSGLADHKISVVLNATFPPRVTHHPDLIARLREAAAEIVYVAASWNQDLGNILSDLQASGLPLTMLAGDSANQIGAWENGIPMSTPLYYTFLPDPQSNPSAAPLAALAKSRGLRLNRVSFYAYAGITAWADAVRRAGTLDAADVSRVLHRDKFSTVLGEIEFDGKGDLKPPSSKWIWYRWLSGKLDRIDDDGTPK